MPLTAIIIDDEVDSVDVLSEFLSNNGIQIVGKGYNGEDAIRLYSELKPNVVLLDLHMSATNGFVALQKIHRINPKAKVIMVTGDSHYDTNADLKDLGASAIVHKTNELNNLPNLIDRVCNKGFQRLKIFKRK